MEATIEHLVASAVVWAAILLGTYHYVRERMRRRKLETDMQRALDRKLI